MQKKSPVKAKKEKSGPCYEFKDSSQQRTPLREQGKKPPD